MSKEIIWKQNKEQISQEPSVREFLEAKIDEKRTLAYLNMKRSPSVDNYSMFYLENDSILATFCDSKIKIPTSTDISLPTSMFLIRNKGKKEISEELYNIGKNLGDFMPFFDSIQTEVKSFKKELNIMQTIIQNINRYEKGIAHNSDANMIWYYSPVFLK